MKKFLFFAITTLALGVLTTGILLAPNKDENSFELSLTGQEDATPTPEGTVAGASTTPEEILTFVLSSPAFQSNQEIPDTYTCNGEGINPPLVIDDVPDGAESLALVVDDPDATNGTYVHWLLWNIDPNTSQIIENSLPEDARIGTNSAGMVQYQPPCPTSGTHRYFFKLYALDTTLDIHTGARFEEMVEAMDGHILEEVQLVGLVTK